MKKFSKRALALFLTAVMVLSMSCVTAFAVDNVQQLDTDVSANPDGTYYITKPATTATGTKIVYQVAEFSGTEQEAQTEAASTISAATQNPASLSGIVFGDTELAVTTDFTAASLTIDPTAVSLFYTFEVSTSPDGNDGGDDLYIVHAVDVDVLSPDAADTIEALVPTSTAGGNVVIPLESGYEYYYAVESTADYDAAVTAAENSNTTYIGKSALQLVLGSHLHSFTGSVSVDGPATLAVIRGRTVNGNFYLDGYCAIAVDLPVSASISGLTVTATEHPTGQYFLNAPDFTSGGTRIIYQLVNATGSVSDTQDEWDAIRYDYVGDFVGSVSFSEDYCNNQCGTITGDGVFITPYSSGTTLVHVYEVSVAPDGVDAYGNYYNVHALGFLALPVLHPETVGTLTPAFSENTVSFSEDLRYDYYYTIQPAATMDEANTQAAADSAAIIGVPRYEFDSTGLDTLPDSVFLDGPLVLKVYEVETIDGVSYLRRAYVGSYDEAEYDIQNLILSSKIHPNGTYYFYNPTLTASGTRIIYDVTNETGSVADVQASWDYIKDDFIGDVVGSVVFGEDYVDDQCNTVTGNGAFITPYPTGTTLISAYEVSVNPDGVDAYGNYYDVYAIAYLALPAISADDVRELTPTVSENSVSVSKDIRYDYYYSIHPEATKEDADAQAAADSAALIGVPSYEFDPTGLTELGASVNVEGPAVLTIYEVVMVDGISYLHGAYVGSFDKSVSTTVAELTVTANEHPDGTYYLPRPAFTSGGTRIIYQVVTSNESVSDMQDGYDNIANAHIGQNVGNLQFAETQVAACTELSADGGFVTPDATKTTLICAYEISVDPDGQISGGTYVYNVYALGFLAVPPLTAGTVEALNPTVDRNDISLTLESGYDYYCSTYDFSDYASAEAYASNIELTYLGKPISDIAVTGSTEFTGSATVQGPASFAIFKTKEVDGITYLYGVYAGAFDAIPKIQALTPTVDGNTFSLTPEAGYEYYYAIDTSISSYVGNQNYAANQFNYMLTQDVRSVATSHLPTWPGEVTPDGPGVIVILKVQNGLLYGYYIGAFDAIPKIQALTPTVDGNGITLPCEPGYEYYYEIFTSPADYAEAQELAEANNSIIGTPVIPADTAGAKVWTGYKLVGGPAVIGIYQVENGNIIGAAFVPVDELPKVQVLTPAVNGNEVSLTPEAGYRYCYGIVDFDSYEDAEEWAKFVTDVNIDTTVWPVTEDQVNAETVDWPGSVTVDGPATLHIIKLESTPEGYLVVGYYVGAFDEVSAGGTGGGVSTGDNTNTPLWAAMMAAAVAGLAGTVLINRKKRT